MLLLLLLLLCQVALVGKGLTFDSGGYNLKVQGGIGALLADSKARSVASHPAKCDFSKQSTLWSSPNALSTLDDVTVVQCLDFQYLACKTFLP